VTRESDLLVFFRALALGLLSSFLIFSLQSNSFVIKARDTKLVVVLAGNFVFQVIEKRKLTRSVDRLREGRVERDPAFVASSTGSRFARTEPR
jgi:hypothetical protein